jgi:hypothetical protein
MDGGWVVTNKAIKGTCAFRMAVHDWIEAAALRCCNSNQRLVTHDTLPATTTYAGYDADGRRYEDSELRPEYHRRLHLPCGQVRRLYQKAVGRCDRGKRQRLPALFDRRAESRLEQLQPGRLWVTVPLLRYAPHAVAGCDAPLREAAQDAAYDWTRMHMFMRSFPVEARHSPEDRHSLAAVG